MTDQFRTDVSTIYTADGPSIQTSKNRPYRNEDYVEQGKQLYDFFIYAERALKDKHDQWIDWWKRYEGDNSKISANWSQEEKEWRAAVMVPWDYSGIQTIVAHMMDLIRSVTPPVQAQGVGVEDDDAAAMENLFAYTLRMNDFEGVAQDVITQACVQGVSYAKLTYSEQCHTFNFKPTQRDLLIFSKAIRDAEGATQTKAPLKDAMALNLWMQAISQAYPSIKFPPIPVAGPKEVYTFRGPMLSVVNGFDLFYDPTIRLMKDQDVIVNRLYQPREWTLQNAGPKGRFSMKAIEVASGPIRTNTVSDQTQQVLDIVKVSQASGDQNPLHRQVDEILEIWAPGFDPPYVVLLNQSPTPINNNVGEYPYEHGQQPFFAVNNVPGQFDATGMSEYQRTITLYEEADRIRSCHATAVTMATFPAMKRLEGVGMSSGLKFPRPGRTYPVRDMADYAPLFTNQDKQIGAAVGYLQYVEMEVDAANGTYGQVRGADAEVGRVSATEQAGRMRSTMTRIALRLANFERGLNPALIQILMLWGQYGSDDALINIGGGTNPLANVSRDMLYEGIQQDYSFVFSTQSQDPSMEIQQTGQILSMFPDLPPAGRMELLAQLLSKLRIKNIQKIIAPAPPPQQAQPPQPGEEDMNQADQQAEQDSASLDQAAQADGAEQAAQGQPPPPEEAQQ